MGADWKFGSMVGRGDVAGSDAYHADVTLGYGVRYVWRGRTTGVTGQDVPMTVRRISGLFDAGHAVGSARTMMKEAVKVCLGRCGRSRWEMYAENRVYRASRLRDGRGIWEFMRSNPYWAGSGQGDVADAIGEVLTDRMLDRLIGSEGVCVLYTHLGKVRDPSCPFSAEARRAFARLADRQSAGKLQVTTTHRLLRYLTVRDGLRYSADRAGDRVVIRIDKIADEVFGDREPARDDVDGLTFELPRGLGAVIQSRSGEEWACETFERGDKVYAKMPWRPMSFPEW